MMNEPDFLSQNAERLDRDATLAWFRDRFYEAKERGAAWARQSVHPEKGWLLFEAWKARPEDEGEQRWQVTGQ
jgi:hypothetical protein